MELGILSSMYTTSAQTVIESALLALVLQATLEHAKRHPSPDLRMRGTAIIITTYGQV